jgi:hypothetical protein
MNSPRGGTTVSSRRLRPWTFSWSGLAIGPTAWAMNTQLNYALVDWACGRGWNPTPAIAAVLALISLAAAVSSFFAWQRHDGPRMRIPERDGHPRYLLSGIGVAAGLLFAVVIALQGLGSLLLEPCLR